MDCESPDTLDREPPPAGLPEESHELWRVASLAIVNRGPLGMAGLHTRAILRLEAENNLLKAEVQHLRRVIANIENEAE